MAHGRRAVAPSSGIGEPPNIGAANAVRLQLLTGARLGEVLKPSGRILISIEGLDKALASHEAKAARARASEPRSSGPRLVNFRARRSRRTPSFPRASAWEIVARYKEILGLRDA
jgi:hypothetical protein